MSHQIVKAFSAFLSDFEMNFSFHMENGNRFSTSESHHKCICVPVPVSVVLCVYVSRPK